MNYFKPNLFQIILFINFILLYSVEAQVQIGNDITGLLPGDQSGHSVALSSDGSVMAIGAPGLNSGRVRVFEWNGSSWNQLGNNIDGDLSGDKFGSSVSLSANGYILAIGVPSHDSPWLNTGKVKVYEWDGNTWNQQGGDILGNDFGSQAGTSVALSADGNTIIIGAPEPVQHGFIKDSARVFEWNGSNWQQLGSDIGGSDSQAGRSVAISSDGSIIAVGRPNLSRVELYEWSSNSWNIIGAPINGQHWGNFAGGSVALSGDGMVVALGARASQVNGTGSGEVGVFKFVGGVWMQQGNYIYGDNAGARFGASVSLSKNGEILSVLASHSAECKVFNFINGSWIQLGNTIPLSGFTSSLTSTRVPLSYSGDTLSIGVAETGNGGLVKAFDISISNCADIYEPNNTIATADVTAFPQFNISDGNVDTIIRATIHEIGEDDYYRLDIEGDGVLEIELTHLNTNCNLILLDSNGNVVQSQSNIGVSPELINYVHDPENNDLQTLYLKVDAVGNQLDCDEYSLRVQLARPLIKTNWHQQGIYNSETPTWGLFNKRSLSGCGPTALSQICWYYEWPNQGAGSISYSVKENSGLFTASLPSKTISENFNHAFNYSTNQDISQLVYEVGAAVKASFGLKYTGVFATDMRRGMVEHLQFSNSAEIWRSDDYTPFQIMAKIIENINAKRPIILFGDRNNSDGDRHVMIIDGVSPTTSEVHVNYGWTTTCANGYYNLFDLLCDDDGCTSNECRQFFRNKILIFDIWPNDPNYTIPSSVRNSDQYPIEKSVITCPTLLYPEPNQIYDNNELVLIWEEVESATNYLVTVKSLGNNITYYEDEGTYAGGSSFFETDILPVGDSIEVTIKPVDVNGAVMSCSTQKFYTSNYECNLIINDVQPVCVNSMDYELEVDFSGVATNLYNIIIEDDNGIVNNINNVSPGVHTIGNVPVANSSFVRIEDAAQSSCVNIETTTSPFCVDCESFDISILDVTCNGTSLDMLIGINNPTLTTLDLYTNVTGVNEFRGITSSGQFLLSDVPFDSDLSIIVEDAINPYDCFEIISYGSVECGACNVDCELKIEADDPASSRFGTSISLFDSTMVVGADGNNTSRGSAYLYKMDGCNYEEIKLSPSGLGVFDWFGLSVSNYQNRVLVGAWGDDDNGTNAGCAYLYEFDGTNYTETKILASDGTTQSRFGRACDMDDNRYAVGASGDGGKGSVYVYDWDGTNWIETKILAPNPNSVAFGISIELKGDRMLVGDYLNSTNGTASGSAYIYDWDGTSWIPTGLFPSDIQNGDWFGFSLDFDGDDIVIGAPFDDDNGGNSGSVYRYQWDGMSWTYTKLLASDGGVNKRFGDDVVIHNSKIYVSSARDNQNGLNSGSLYIYENISGSITETKILPSDGASDDFFGKALAVSDEHVFVGAYENGSGPGSVYRFDQNPSYYYSDSDSDGFGHTTNSVSACFQPHGYVINNLDCNDNNPNINPMIDEECDGIDNNCDGLFDEGNICCDNGLLTNRFIGSSEDWFDASNWSLSIVPTICHRVIIPNGKIVRIAQGQSGICFTVESESGGLLDVRSGALLQVVAPNN